jgi:hypothetical protein
VGRRLQRPAIPSLALLCVWLAVGLALGALFRFEWIGRTVILVVSPLWFIAVYLMLVLLIPLMLWLHQRLTRSCWSSSPAVPAPSTSSASSTTCRAMNYAIAGERNEATEPTVNW